MRTVANVIWVIFGGLESALAWCVAGVVLYVTVVGIPLGRQCFKMASLTLAPFGKEIVYGGGAPSAAANVVWVLVVGLWMSLAYVLIGALYCVTVVGIPIGLQCFKMGKLSLMPFGASVLG